jgi:tetratricopeptide (TPR) repeat protein
MRRLTFAAVALLAVPLFAQVPQAAALFEQGRFEEAKRLVAPLKNNPDALVILGKIAMAQNDAETAEGYLEKAVELKPNSAEAHLWLGNAYGSQAQNANMFKQASLAGKTKSEFERAVELDPNLIDARLGLIDYYSMAPAFMGGSEEKAVQQANEIRKRDAYQGHRAFARVYTRQKKVDLARKEWVDAIREQPQAAKPHNALAAFYAFTDKNYKAAFDEAETALKLEPNYVSAHFRIGQIAAVSGINLAHGEEELKKYLTHKPGENEPDLAITHYYLGMVYEKQGKKAEAKQSYAAALKMNPGSKTYTEALKRVS